MKLPLLDADQKAIELTDKKFDEILEYAIQKNDKSFSYRDAIAASVIAALSLPFYYILVNEKYPQWSLLWCLNVLGACGTNYLVSSNILYILLEDRYIETYPEKYKPYMKKTFYQYGSVIISVCSALPLAAAAIINEGIGATGVAAFVVTLISNGFIHLLPIKLLSMATPSLLKSKERLSEEWVKKEICEAIDRSDFEYNLSNKDLINFDFIVKGVPAISNKKLDNESHQAYKIILNSFGILGLIVGVTHTMGYAYSVYSSVKNAGLAAIISMYIFGTMSEVVFNVLVGYFSFGAVYDIIEGVFDFSKEDIFRVKTLFDLFVFSFSLTASYFSTAPALLATAEMAKNCSLPLIPLRCSISGVSYEFLHIIVLLGTMLFNSKNTFQLLQKWGANIGKSDTQSENKDKQALLSSMKSAIQQMELPLLLKKLEVISPVVRVNIFGQHKDIPKYVSNRITIFSEKQESIQSNETPGNFESESSLKPASLP